MKKIVRKKVLYRCPVCKTAYPRKKDALRCEKLPVEKRAFRVGDKVRNIEPRTCEQGKNYLFSGKVVRVLGPESSDYEYEVKWLGGKGERMNSHVFVYEVEFRCPHCKKQKRARYYAPELIHR